MFNLIKPFYMATGKELFIIRHAKSDWDTVVDDMDRPLTERGVNNAYQMAERLKNDGKVPGLLLTSTAVRAFHTAVIMHRVWELENEALLIRPRLYMGSQDEILQVLAEIPEKEESAAIFGHNPSFTDLANRFLSEKVDKIHTAGVARFMFEEGTWKDLGRLQLNEEFVDYPKRKRPVK